MRKRVLVALCTATGLLAPAGFAAVAPVTAYAATNTVLQVGSRGSEVAQLQRTLNTLGFHVGTVDGVFGSHTAAAVMAFQRSRHLSADGIVGRNTWAALGNAGNASGSTQDRAPASRAGSMTNIPRYPGRLIEYGRRGSDVREVQAQLNRLGYHCGAADGIYGSHTYAAIRAFQRAHHLGQDGVVGPATWPILFGASSATPASRGSSTPTTVVYTVYDYFGNKLGTSATLGGAEALAKQHPASVVKDASGKILYYQTGYVAYQDPAHVIGVYPYYGEAKSKAGARGYVVNDYHYVDKQPSEYYYLNNGKWYSSQYGVQGSATPSSSQVTSGVRYLPVTPASGAVNSIYYPFEQGTSGNGAYIGNPTKSFSWENPYRTANLTLPYTTLPSGQPATGDNIDSYIASVSPASSLFGLGYAYMDAQKFGSNAVYLFTHSILESGWGNSSIAQGKNNLFGYGAYDSSPGNDAGAFPTDDYAIHFQSWFVRNAYLNPGATYNTPLGPTLDGMNVKYATDPNWSAAIAGLVNNYADQNGYTTNGSTPITPITDTNGPNGNGEPVYLADDFQAVVPTFPGNLTSDPNVAKDSVKTLQDALNVYGCGPLQVDGEFGPATLTAVNKYQAKVGLPQSATVDSTMWAHLFPSIQGLTGVSEIYMSFTSGLPFDQVLTNTGARPYEPLIHFTNVYRVEPVQGAFGSQARIAVYTSEATPPNTNTEVTDTDGKPVYLHAGDYVSNDNGGQADSTSYVKVNFTQWRDGAPVAYTGYVPSNVLLMQKDAAGNMTMPTYNGLDPANEQ